MYPVDGPAARDRGSGKAEPDPHVELDFLRQPETRVQQMHQAAGRAGPKLDLERQQVIFVSRTELHLPGLHVAAQGHQVQASRGAVDDPDGPVPGPRHLHQQLVRNVQSLVAELTEADADDLGGNEVLEVVADPLNELARVDFGRGDAYPEQAVEHGTAAVLRQLHSVVDSFGGQMRWTVARIALALAPMVDLRGPVATHAVADRRIAEGPE
ncbi:hypothetical protein [Streptomyces sp. NPDC039016]|uniref:hypothetical protein n=1 Tax=Streptomyces sp. NPDC039016 TaxID=3154330 RepID=UPI00340C703C